MVGILMGVGVLYVRRTSALHAFCTALGRVVGSEASPTVSTDSPIHGLWLSESCFCTAPALRHHSPQCLGSFSVLLLRVLVPGCCFNVINARKLMGEKKEPL
uniref:Putative secreted protein n=1 Tax=Ixodes ricinus TaxID=34613 RepID=A0A6B0UFD9_IXORI